jgi:competence protein ComEA
MADDRRDWTASAAKWVVVVVLGGASVGGIVWTIATRPAPAGNPAPVAAGSGDVESDASRTTPENVARRVDAMKPNGGVANAADEPSGGRDPQAQASAPRLININTASAAELELLPQIGPTLAARIVADRTAGGPFASLDDLERVRGIGPRTVEKIRDLAVAR